MGVQGWGGGEGGSGRVVLIHNGRVYQSKAADALGQVKTTKFSTNVGLNMLLNISSRYLGGLFLSRQLRGLPSSDGYFLYKWVYRKGVVGKTVLANVLTYTTDTRTRFSQDCSNCNNKFINAGGWQADHLYRWITHHPFLRHSFTDLKLCVDDWPCNDWYGLSHLTGHGLSGARVVLGKIVLGKTCPVYGLFSVWLGQIPSCGNHKYLLHIIIFIISFHQQ